MPTAPESPYEVLGVDAAASADEIRRAYLRLARVHHPDRAAAADATADGGESEGFRRIQRAYDVVRDPESRRVWDVHARAALYASAGAEARTLEVDLDAMQYAEEGEPRRALPRRHASPARECSPQGW